MSVAHSPAVLIGHACDLAPSLLARTQERWQHTVGVARRIAGYPFALSLMVTVSLLLFTIFKRRGWL